MQVKISQLINDNNNPAANQFIITTPKATFFQSYDSVICRIPSSGGQITIGRDWDYSNTTRKHLYIFLRDKGFHVRSKKDILEGFKTKRFRYDESLH